MLSTHIGDAQGGSNYPLRGWKAQLYEGGMRVPGFVHSPLLPKAAQGTVSEKIFHVSDWLPTLIKRCGGRCEPHPIITQSSPRYHLIPTSTSPHCILAYRSTVGSLPLDGYDIWRALIDPATPSPRTEILHNFNAACGRGKFSLAMPNSAIRVGDHKLLVQCFNKTTLAPNPGSTVEVYNIKSDPFETTDLSVTQPVVTKQLLAALAGYARSADQVPASLKPTLKKESGEVGFNGSTR